jgi:hypothetical protein
MSSEAVNQKTDNIVAKSKEQRIKTYTESQSFSNRNHKENGISNIKNKSLVIER